MMNRMVNTEALARIRARRTEMKVMWPDAIEEISPALKHQLGGEQSSAPPELPTLVSHINPEMLGKHLGEIVSKKLKEINEKFEGRIAQLEQELKGRKAMTFKGEFQRAVAYQEGDVVSFNEKLYCAAKDIPAGGNLRNGQEGWVFMFKGTE